MDKLELDGRVARLERSVGLLWAAVGAFLTVGIIALMAVLVARSESRLGPPATMTPSPPVTVSDHVEVRASEGSLDQLAQRLRELSDLRTRGLLNSSEYQAKKDQLLAKPLRPGDLTSDLGLIEDLRQGNVLSSSEHAALKAKVLEIAK